MAIRKIIRMGHPTLRQVAVPVAPEAIGTRALAKLVDDMIDTLHDYGGVGLAAPQINEPIRLAIIEAPGGPSRYGEVPPLPLTVFVNPVVTILDPALQGCWEGCLSVPGLRGYVQRPRHVRVSAQRLDGSAFEIELQDFLATVIQHEFDHLDGKLYLDRITDRSRIAFDEEYLRYHTAA